MKTLRKVCAFILALATLFSLAGCVNHNWSVKTDNEQVSAGVYIYYMLTAYNDAVTKLDDETQDVLTATIDGKTGKQWILDEARSYCKRHFVVKKLCAERNITLSTEDVSTIDYTINYMVQYYGTFYESAGISIESVREVYENSYLYSDLLYSYYDGDGEKALKEEDIKKHFSETYFAYKVLEVPFYYTENSKEVSYSADEIKERQELVKQYFEEASKLDTADIDEYNKKFVNRDLKEGEKETEPAKLTLQFATKDTSTNYGDEFFDTLKNAAVGDFFTTEVTNKGIYFFQKCDEYSEDSKKYKDTRETCIAEMVEDEFKSLLDGKAAQMSFVFNEKAIEEYNLEDLITLLNSDAQ